MVKSSLVMLVAPVTATSRRQSVMEFANYAAWLNLNKMYSHYLNCLFLPIMYYYVMYDSLIIVQ